MNTKKKPLFRRTQGAMYRRLKGKGWRRPRGKHNKIRENKKGKGYVPSIGYGSELKLRHRHPSGLEERAVSNSSDILKIDPESQAARMSSRLGKRKKALLIEKIKDLKIKVLNP
jgi:large subunit ribosomal protein L32e